MIILAFLLAGDLDEALDCIMEAFYLLYFLVEDAPVLFWVVGDLDFVPPRADPALS